MIAESTDRQLVDLYLHPRDKDGRIKSRQSATEADEAMSPEAADAMVYAMGRAMGMTDEQLQALVEKRKRGPADG